MSATRAAAVLAAVILAATVPFATKAVHIDDVYFIEVAANVLKHPLQPYSGAVALEDIDYRVFAARGECPTTFASMSHPPLVPYVLAVVAWLTGGFHELAMHLAFLPFALGAGLAVHALAGRFTQAPLSAALLIVGSPIFVLAAQGLATDMAALCFALAAMALGIQGIDHDERRLVLLAGVFAGLASVTRYSTLATVPLLLVYGLTRGRARRALPALAGLLAVFGAWCAHNLVSDGRLHLLASSAHYRSFYAAQSFDTAGLVKKTLADTSALGGMAFVAAALVLMAVPRRLVVFVLAAAAAVGLFLASPAGIERLETYSRLEVAAVAGCFACGAVLVHTAFARRLPRAATLAADAADQAFLRLWLAVTFAGAVVFLPFGTARYMLPVLPPLWLLVVRALESGGETSRWWRPGLRAAIAQGLVLSLALSLADSEYAGRYRALARSFAADQPGKTLWFVGEWGFRHYMHQAGGRYLTSSDDTPPAWGLLIRPAIAGMHAMSAGLGRRAVEIQDFELQSRWPIRLMSFDAHAGYYSHHWGYLPWTLSRAPLERVEIFEIRTPPPADAAATPCASS